VCAKRARSLGIARNLRKVGPIGLEGFLDIAVFMGTDSTERLGNVGAGFIGITLPFDIVGPLGVVWPLRVVGRLGGISAESLRGTNVGPLQQAGLFRKAELLGISGPLGVTSFECLGSASVSFVKKADLLGISRSLRSESTSAGVGP
jgi:hypothetical protein